MSTKAKVGTWLGKGSAEAKGDANDSDSEASDITAPSDAGDDVQQPGNAEEDDDDEDGAITPADDEAARELNIDWEVVLPKVRPALLDKSRKRREQFAARFLYVSDECRLSWSARVLTGTQLRLQHRSPVC